jgi:ketosteroid isomerase-like protein
MSDRTAASASAVLDVTASDPTTATFLASYFAAESAHDPAGSIAHFSPGALTYSESPWGWVTDGFPGIQAGFETATPTWGDAISYPTGITGITGGFPTGDGGAVVAFTNTPRVVGRELLHILAAVDVRDHEIVRWVDYWDSSGIDPTFQAAHQAPSAAFPQSFHEDDLEVMVPEPLRGVAPELARALSAGDAAGAAALFDADGVLEDDVLRTRVVGRRSIAALLGRTADTAP